MYSVCKNQVVSWLHFDQKNETYTTKIHRSIFSPSFDETRLPVDNSSHNNTALQNHVKRSPYTLRIQTHSAHAWPASTKTQVTTPAGRTKHGHMTVISTRGWGGGGGKPRERSVSHAGHSRSHFRNEQLVSRINSDCALYTQTILTERSRINSDCALYTQTILTERSRINSDCALYTQTILTERSRINKKNQQSGHKNNYYSRLNKFVCIPGKQSKEREARFSMITKKSNWAFSDEAAKTAYVGFPEHLGTILISTEKQEQFIYF